MEIKRGGRTQITFHDEILLKRGTRIKSTIPENNWGPVELRSWRSAPSSTPETVMPSRMERHMELLALSQPLHRYARSVQSDANAAFLLVHRALSKAFAEKDGHLRPSAGLEASLRADMDRGLRTRHGRP
jgi:hypothetical protein